jgi:hypothetical protein
MDNISFSHEYIEDALKLGTTIDPIIGTPTSEANQLLVIQGVADSISLISSPVWTFVNSPEVEEPLAKYNIKCLKSPAPLDSCEVSCED